MSILVTISVNLAESASLRELRQFVAMAERHGADLDVDLREYDENGALVGLAAVGQLEPTGEGRSADDDGDAPLSDRHRVVEGDDHDGTDTRTADE
jgi:hypothetical protein